MGNDAGRDAGAPAGTPVGREDLERLLARVRAAVRDPRAGLFGPGSRVWAVNREAVTFLGGGRAALLQLAHPFVAHAVDQHSTTRADPFGRFVRTFEYVFAMVYGDLDAALAAARRLHALHARITGTVDERVGPYAPGTPYAANTAEALLWVHATLWDTTIQVSELVVGPLAPAEKDAYYEETKRFAWLFGIPDTVLPSTWSDFRAYVEDMVRGPALAVGRPAAEMARFLLRPPGAWLGPLWAWNAVMTAGLLPERLREAYGLPFGRRERAAFDVSLATLRAARRVLPERLRHLPAYVAAERRLAGVDGPDLIGRVTEWVGRSVLGAR